MHEPRKPVGRDAETADDELARAPVPPHPVLALQSLIGNRAVASLLQRGKPTREPSTRPTRKAKDESPFASKVKKRTYHSARLREKHGLPPTRASRSLSVEPDFARNVIWTGQRPGWDSDIYEHVLSTKGDPTPNPGPRGAVRTTYCCAKCGQYFPRKRDRVGKEATIDIDHKKDWDTWITSHIDPREMKDRAGHKWSAYRFSDAKGAYNDVSNLVPMCSRENRSKSGPKTIDRVIRPRHLKDDCDACIEDSEDESEMSEDSNDT